MIFFADFIQSLGEQLKVKQQVVATAVGYFKRFYVINSLKDVDPFLLAPTSLFLASKVEEFGVISNTRLIASCQGLLKTKYVFLQLPEYSYRSNNVLECEFYLLEMLDCSLLFYQPYRPLVLLASDMGQEDKILPLAWNLVNDSLRTDLCLKTAPHLIAITCLHLACVLLQKNNYVNWFAELNVDWDLIVEITSEIVNLYDIWNEMDDKNDIPQILNKLPKVKLNSSNLSIGNNAQSSNNLNNSLNMDNNCLNIMNKNNNLNMC
ncbi:cyclin-C-like isoform X2 [Gordionus sp. m RMFG-2023]